MKNLIRDRNNLLFLELMLGVGPSPIFKTKSSPCPTRAFFSDNAREPQPEKNGLSAFPIRGIEHEFSKLNQAQAYILPSRAML